jgi:GNAT superfamily N-acetyltransferase
MMEIKTIDLASPLLNMRVMELLAEVDHEFEPPLSSRLNLSEYAMKLRERGQVIGGFADNVLRGIIGFYCNDQITHTGFITIVAVRPVFRARGLGTELILAALKVARQAGMVKVHLQTSTRNRAARWYEKIGFRTVGAAPERPGGHGILMEYVFADPVAEGQAID